ncbi:hypothetical protein BYT27DRAFT_6744699 [Phlegmacium glaucopus]|nr:hypothetical protein BYT27DRAFT_6744699 [Phlegmacium glaucopus]
MVTSVILSYIQMATIVSSDISKTYVASLFWRIEPRRYLECVVPPLPFASPRFPRFSGHAENNFFYNFVHYKVYIYKCPLWSGYTHVYYIPFISWQLYNQELPNPFLPQSLTLPTPKPLQALPIPCRNRLSMLSVSRSVNLPMLAPVFLALV